uniref:Uncharacterized protein n=1 Tax=Echinococcus canadensis TaxID=519352 RepID=A0A915F032_9CEST
MSFNAFNRIRKILNKILGKGDDCGSILEMQKRSIGKS